MATTAGGQPSGLPVDNPTASYWHKEPSTTLLGHRTTADLPPVADVVIVGSGITGAIAAHTLRDQRPGLRVVMLEAREACWGATGRNGGHCQPAMYAAAPHIASFELRTYSYLKALVEAYSIPCDWKTTTGVHAYFSAELFAAAQAAIARLADAFPDLAANVAVVTRGDGKVDGKGEGGGPPPWLLEGERRELTLDGLRVPDAVGAVVMWHAASLWPYKLVAFVLERLLAANSDDEAGFFNLQTKTPVTSLQKVEPPTTTTTTSADSVPGWVVHTPRGHIAARSVLLATNAYTSAILPAFADLVVPTRGQVAALKPPSSSSPTTQPPLDIGHTYYILGDAGDRAFKRDDYLVQRPPPAAELVLGGGRHLARDYAVGVWDDAALDEPVRWWLRGELTEAMDLGVRPPPAAVAIDEGQGSEKEGDEKGAPTTTSGQQQKRKQDLEATHEWTGIMGYSRDGAPWVGAVPTSLGGDNGNYDTITTTITTTKSNNNSDENETEKIAGLWVSAGYTGHGMPNAALCGKAVAELMLGRDEIDLPPEYELTEARVAAARALRDSVAVADARGDFDGVFGMV